jgi:diguanylate cyclase
VKTAIGGKARAYRYGGEEMAVVLPNYVREEAVAISERVRQAVEKRRVDVDGSTIGVTVSVGLAEHFPGEPASQLIDRADTALYQAKEAGRNRVCLADNPS